MSITSELDFSAFTDAEAKAKDSFPSKEEEKAFAVANNFTYDYKVPYDPSETSPFFMRGGYAPILGPYSYFEHIAGEFKGMPCRLFRFDPFDYTNFGTVNTKTILSITLPQAMPYILFHAFLGRTHPEYLSPVQLGSGQKIVTGDTLFDSYFEVFAPVAFRDEVRQKLLTSDFLATLLQYAAVFDVEICGNKLYIYCDTRLSGKNYLEAYTAAAAIIKVMQPSLDAGALRIPDTASQASPRPDHLVFNRGSLGRLVAIASAFTLFGTIIIGYAVLSAIRDGRVNGISIILLLILGISIGIAIKVTNKRRHQRPANLEALRERFGTVNGL